MTHSIQRLADRIGVGRETLRHYENRGLIAPRRDPENGYRWYSDLDGLSVLEAKTLQSHALSLEEIAGEASEWSLREQLEHLDREEIRLQASLEHIRTKLSRIAKFKSFLQDALNPQHCVQQINTFGIYKLMLLGDEVSYTPRLGEAARQWIAQMPVPDIGWQIPLQRVTPPEARNVPTALGLMVLPRYMEDYAFDMNPPVYFFPPGRSARMMLAVEDPFHISHAQLRPLFDYVRENGLTICSDISGRYSGSECVNGRRKYYFSARVLVQ